MGERENFEMGEKSGFNIKSLGHFVFPLWCLIYRSKLYSASSAQSFRTLFLFVSDVISSQGRPSGTDSSSGCEEVRGCCRGSREI